MKKDIKLDPEVTKNDKCQLSLNHIKNIYFNFNKYTIRVDAKTELDKVVAIMNECSKITIKIGVHTDSRGTIAYNKYLSQKRANAIKSYIVSKGVNTKRINAIGYGESQINNRCKNGVRCRESEHQENRRAEFTIITK
jgi:outer membrane protein OmpA-like peptidoglycan-associated protein